MRNKGYTKHSCSTDAFRTPPIKETQRLLHKFFKLYHTNLAATTAIIFTDTRCGTNALAATLRKNGQDLFATHSIGKNSKNASSLFVGFSKGKVDKKARKPLSIKHILLPLFANATTIYTCVRDPVARALSAFVSGGLSHSTDFFINAPIDEIYREFYKRCDEYPDILLNWFDNAFYPDTGIDVYRYPFNKETGYGIIEQDNKRVFILKAETAHEQSKNQVASEALSLFSGVKIDRIETKAFNHSDARPHYERYCEIVDYFIATDEYLDHVYNSKYAKHFYTEDEIKAFKVRWKHL